MKNPVHPNRARPPAIDRSWVPTSSDFDFRICDRSRDFVGLRRRIDRLTDRSWCLVSELLAWVEICIAAKRKRNRLVEIEEW
ncbi:hypothetical protein AKJ16_DCAP23636 [Drosera capensis]